MVSFSNYSLCRRPNEVSKGDPVMIITVTTEILKYSEKEKIG